MLIGSCRDCNEICSETSRAAFDRIHEDKKHSVFAMKDFIDDNEAFIQKVQRTWKTFDLNVQHFFKNLHSKLEKIEKDVYERIIEQELRTAVNSNDKRAIELARSVLNEKFKDLTCRDIEEFVEIRKRQEGNPNFLYIQKKEEDFAFDILDEIKRTAYDLGKNLYDGKGKHQRKAQIPKPAAKQEPPKRQQERKREEPARREPQKIVEKKEAPREQKREERPDRERRQERVPRQARPPRQERRQRQDRQPRQERRPRQDRQRRQDRPTRQDRQPRQPRQDRKPRQDRQPRQDRPPRQERKPREDWPTREDRPPRQERRQRQDRQPRQDRLPRRQERPQRADHKRIPRRDYNQGKQYDRQQKIFKKVKISELRQSDDELSLDLKLISLVKNVKQRDVWLVGDQTGEIKLIIPNHESFKPGVAITLNNCYVKDYHGQLQLNAKLFSTITSAAIGKDVDVGSLQKELRERPQRRRQTAPIALTKISSIQPGMEGMKIIAKVLSVKTKGQIAECVLGDDTGVLNARFKASEFLKEDNSIYCRGICSDIDGTVQGTIYLFQGNRFMIQNAREGVRKINKELNVSLRVYLVQGDQ